jgi:hypothetical protein
MRANQQLRFSLKGIDGLKAVLSEHALAAIAKARGRITCVSDRFYAILKYPREELIRRDPCSINSVFIARDSSARCGQSLLAAKF